MFQRPPYRDLKNTRLMLCVLAICGFRLMYCAACNTIFDISESKSNESNVWCPNCGKCVMGTHQHEDNKARGAA